MPRYTTIRRRQRPRASEIYWPQDTPCLPDLTVYDDGEQYTGLLDHRGVEYVRVMDKIGFMRRGDGEAE